MSNSIISAKTFNKYETSLNEICKNNQNAIFNDMNIKKIYTIGDLHGDYERLEDILLNIIKVFKKNKNTNNSNNSSNIIWKKRIKNTYIIQIGDMTDGYRRNYKPYDDYISKDIEIIQLLHDLDNQAIELNNNCRFISLIGNHEILNIGSFYGTAFDHMPSNQEVQTRSRIIHDTNVNNILLCHFYPYVIINGFLFAHHGIIRYFIDYINRKFGIDLASMLSEARQINERINILNKVIKVLIFYINKKSGIINELQDMSETSGDKFIKTRNKAIKYKLTLNNLHEFFYSEEYDKRNTNCSHLDEILDFFNVKGMIIGHYPQKNIDFDCDNKLVRTDIRISRLFGESSTKIIEVLLIENNKFKVIK